MLFQLLDVTPYTDTCSSIPADLLSGNPVIVASAAVCLCLGPRRSDEKKKENRKKGKKLPGAWLQRWQWYLTQLSGPLLYNNIPFSAYILRSLSNYPSPISLFGLPPSFSLDSILSSSFPLLVLFFLFLSLSSLSLSLSLFLFSSSPFQPTFCVLSFLFFLLFLEYFPFLRAFARTVILTLYYTLSVPWYNYPSHPRDYESVPDPGRRLYFISLCLLSVASDNTVDSSGIRDIIQSDLRPSVGGRNSLVCGRMSPL